MRYSSPNRLPRRENLEYNPRPGVPRPCGLEKRTQFSSEVQPVPPIIQSSVSSPEILIAVQNQSTMYSDDKAQTCIAALQMQVTRDFNPLWGINSTLFFIPKGTPVPDGYWLLTFFDNADQANALGYHDIQANLLPLGKIFVAADIAAGVSPESTASHEHLEMLGDSEINLNVETTNPQGGRRLVAYENSDAPESDQFGYDITVGQGLGAVKVRVSDFCTKAWFSPQAPAGAKFDFMGHITSAFQLLPGGYANVDDGNGWTQIFGEKPADPMAQYRMIAPIGSRRERRRRGRSQWIRSVPR